MLVFSSKTADFRFQVNVRTGEMQQYPLPSGFYTQEPVFLQRPGATGEDEGVLLLQGLDANQNKGQ